MLRGFFLSVSILNDEKIAITNAWVNKRFVFLTIFRFFTVYTLRCNVCTSWLSWADCERSQVALTCEKTDSHCYRHSIEVNVGGTKISTFAKGCAISDKCTPQAISRCKNSQSQNQLMDMKNAKCVLECCNGDLCQ